MTQVFWISASSFQREAEVALSGNSREPDKSPGLPADLLKIFAHRYYVMSFVTVNFH
jgi:hypothetical protein